MTVEVNQKMIDPKNMGIMSSENPITGKKSVLLVTPKLDEEYWLARVKIGKEQAVVCFPKFMTIGIGCQIEKNDWNTNLPYTCSAEEIYHHIRKNAPSVKKEKFVAAIEELQKYIRTDLLREENIFVCENCDHEDHYDNLPVAKNLESRLEPGDIYTDVECPKCGALCYPKEKK